MEDRFEFELVFALPEGSHDPYELSDAVFGSGYEDPLVGTGVPGLLGVGLEVEGSDAEDSILNAARAITKSLPKGTRLREVRPDLVTLAEVAERLGVKRQALQQRAMPLPGQGGLYRIDEIAEAIVAAAKPGKGQRKPKFDIENAMKWFRGGIAARRVNARLALQEIDPESIELQEMCCEKEERIRLPV